MFNYFGDSEYLYPCLPNLWNWQCLLCFLDTPQLRPWIYSCCWDEASWLVSLPDLLKEIIKHSLHFISSAQQEAERARFLVEKASPELHEPSFGVFFFTGTSCIHRLNNSSKQPSSLLQVMPRLLNCCPRHSRKQGMGWSNYDDWRQLRKLLGLCLGPGTWLTYPARAKTCCWTFPIDDVHKLHWFELLLDHTINNTVINLWFNWMVVDRINYEPLK